MARFKISIDEIFNAVLIQEKINGGLPVSDDERRFYSVICMKHRTNKIFENKA